MKISRKHLAQLRVATQPDASFLPVGDTPLQRRRMSMQRQPRTLTKHQLIEVVQSRSASMDVAQLVKAMHLKTNSSGVSGKKLKLQFGRKLRKELSEHQISCALNGSASTIAIQQQTPTVINERHLELLSNIRNALVEFHTGHTLQLVERLALDYCRQAATLPEGSADQLPHLIRKELNNLLNLEKCYMVVLLQVCFHERLVKYYKQLAEALARIIEQYRRFQHQQAKCTGDNDMPQYVSLRNKFKMKTPGLIIKSENYKIYEGFRKTVASMDIGESLRTIMVKLEAAEPDQFWYMLREYYAYHLCMLMLGKPPIKQEYWMLATCPAPYLPYYDGYTLVVDLDETLAHFSPITNTVLVRPFANEFLEKLSAYYEIVLFTAGMPDYANYLISHLQTQGAIRHKLYRYHTSRVDSEKTIKDLERLGRPLSRTLLVDNLPVNFSKQPHNGIQIRSWYGDKDDLELQRIYQHLVALHQKQYDVRDYIRSNLNFTHAP